MEPPNGASHPTPLTAQDRARLARIGAEPGTLTLRARLLSTKIDNHHEDYLRFGDTLSRALARQDADAARAGLRAPPVRR
ncbi:MAG: hypothetical protein HC933_12380, partial [Pleurocapsa sp. SU_196_0]|nr:hypothetical protein [Pleurocapsa sp. SU_196_0]